MKGQKKLIQKAIITSEKPKAAKTLLSEKEKAELNKIILTHTHARTHIYYCAQRVAHPTRVSPMVPKTDLFTRFPKYIDYIINEPMSWPHPADWQYQNVDLSYITYMYVYIDTFLKSIINRHDSYVQTTQDCLAQPSIKTITL